MLELIKKTVATIILSFTLYGLGLFFGFCVIVLYIPVRLFAKNRNLLHFCGTAWGHCVFYGALTWKLKIEGRENIVKTPCVYVANHQSQLDIIVVYLLRIQFRWIAKHTLFKIPIFGWAMRLVGHVPVNRKDKRSHAASLEELKEHVRQGISIIFYPEGTRSTDGVLKQFKTGAFRIACEMQVPVTPITIIGTDTLLPKGNLIPNRATLKIVVHPQIYPQADNFTELMNEARSVIASALPPEKRG